MDEDLIVPIGSTILSTATSRITGASPKVKFPSISATSSSGTPPNSSSSNKWDPPLLCPLPPSFLRLAPSEVCFHFHFHFDFDFIVEFEL